MRRKTAIPVLAAGLAVLMVAGLSRAALISSTDTSSRPGYEIVTFTAGDGTWNVPAGVTSVELLVIGGGGGGMGYGGGGGGGGFFNTGSFAVTPLSGISVAVGTGGAAALRGGGAGPYPESYQASAGGSSQFGAVIAYGGDGGHWVWTSSGAGYGQGGTSGTNNQNSGGGLVADQPSNSYGSGSGAGVKGTAGTSAAGGAGLSSTITGLELWYAGGGGALVNGLGGQDGGGAGGNPAMAGAANSGGGGGAGWAVIGGNGGSGVVIVAYAIPEPASGLLLLAGVAGLGLLRRKLKG